MRLLVVEDEKKVARFIQRGLTQENHVVDLAHDGDQGLAAALSVDYDLIILDITMPRMSGLAALAAIRQSKPQVPILMLTAKSAVDDRITALDGGADDYLLKPFDFGELAARVRALLRRRKSEPVRFTIGDLTLDPATRAVERAGKKIELSLKEYGLLEFLLRHARRPVSRTRIVEHVWAMHSDCITNVVDVYINFLRNKIDRGFDLPLIRTVRGIGYVLTDEQTEAG